MNEFISLHDEAVRDRKDPDTIPYLEKENEYADFVMKGTKQLQEKVYQEFLSKIKETDDSVPYKKVDLVDLWCSNVC